ncbi:MAG TPA: glycosyltransferase family 4 protein [Flavisolibacter sp.]|jgi:glycosyltransferase involved in cell wall biosynthesis
MNSSHIVILCSRLDMPGGTERAVVHTASLLQSRGHRVSLLVLDETAESFYTVSDNIELVQLPLHFGVTVKGNVVTRKMALLGHVRRLKAELDRMQPTLILSTDYVFTIAAWMACGRKGVRIAAWEHHHFHWLKKSRFWNYLFHRIYPKLDAVICLNRTEAALYAQLGCTTKVIPNFISRHQAVPQAPVLLTIGWLIKRKGIDLIPSIAEKVFSKHPEWKWRITGEGKEKEWLKKEIRNRNLQNHITIVPPSTQEVQELYKDASLYIMTSRFECFPLVLLEAMSCGLPCVAFDCPTGPADIIRHGVDGLLVPNEDIEAMSTAIIQLIDNEERRNTMSVEAYDGIDRFSPEKVYALWKEYIG